MVQSHLNKTKQEHWNIHCNIPLTHNETATNHLLPRSTTPHLAFPSGAKLHLLQSTETAAAKIVFIVHHSLLHSLCPLHRAAHKIKMSFNTLCCSAPKPSLVVVFFSSFFFGPLCHVLVSFSRSQQPLLPSELLSSVHSLLNIYVLFLWSSRQHTTVITAIKI